MGRIYFFTDIGEILLILSIRGGFLRVGFKEVIKEVFIDRKYKVN